ncbi:unnamed protein product [Linum trigynum]|uniref:Uncharacterized protein n=1 Tax=Linum trigynum TaxID=586398 RepID=A0AAV2DDD4_9ROSI
MAPPSPSSRASSLPVEAAAEILEQPQPMVIIVESPRRESPRIRPLMPLRKEKMRGGGIPSPPKKKTPRGNHAPPEKKGGDFSHFCEATAGDTTRREAVGGKASLPSCSVNIPLPETETMSTGTNLTPCRLTIPSPEKEWKKKKKKPGNGVFCLWNPMTSVLVKEKPKARSATSLPPRCGDGSIAEKQVTGGGR